MVQVTTPDLIEDEFITLISGLTPRHIIGQASSYTHYKRLSKPSTRTRRFTIRFQDYRPHEEGLMGKNFEEMEADMIVTVDYGGIPEQEVQKVAGDDHVFLEDRFQSRKDPTFPGLMWLTSDGYETNEPDNDGDQAQIEHFYIIRWINARAT